MNLKEDLKAYTVEQLKEKIENATVPMDLNPIKSIITYNSNIAKKDYDELAKLILEKSIQLTKDKQAKIFNDEKNTEEKEKNIQSLIDTRINASVDKIVRQEINPINQEEIVQAIKENKISLGNLIQRIRKKRGITRKDVAENCNVSINTISRIEQIQNDTYETSPKYAKLLEVCSFLGIPEEALVASIYNNKWLTVSYWNSMRSNPMQPTLGSILKQKRISQNITLFQLADITGIQQSNLTRIEISDEFFRKITIVRMLDGLNITLDEIYETLVKYPR